MAVVNPEWVIGAALLGFSLYLSIWQKHAHGLCIANIAIKMTMLLFISLLEFLVLFS